MAKTKKKAKTKKLSAKENAKLVRKQLLQRIEHGNRLFSYLIDAVFPKQRRRP